MKGNASRRTLSPTWAVHAMCPSPPAPNRGPPTWNHDPAAPSVGANPRRIVFSTTLRGSMN